VQPLLQSADVDASASTGERDVASVGAAAAVDRAAAAAAAAAAAEVAAAALVRGGCLLLRVQSRVPAANRVVVHLLTLEKRVQPFGLQLAKQLPLAVPDPKLFLGAVVVYT
jgi:hypothetical protein